MIMLRGLLLSAAGLCFCHKSGGARDGTLQEASSSNCRFFAIRHSDLDVTDNITAMSNHVNVSQSDWRRLLSGAVLHRLVIAFSIIAPVVPPSHIGGRPPDLS
jgi:hypothetical protein